MDHKKLKQRLSDVVLLIIIAGFVALIIAHKIIILDWFYFRTYVPSPQVVGLADAAGFNSLGRRLFYRGDPQLADRATVDNICSKNIIGCITEEGKIYILNDDGGKYYDETVVTAAHEMLHLAYRRLKQSDRNATDALIEAYSATKADGPLEQVLLNSTDTADRNDELHSVLATNYSELTPDLDNYYKRYFADRSKVVAAYQRSQ